MQVTLNLSPEQTQFVQAQIQTGKYSDPQQVISDALLWLQNHGRIEALREEIEIGTAQVQAGETTDGDVVFAQLQNRLLNEFGLQE